MHTDRIPADARQTAIRSLRRAAGQMTAVARMLEEGDDCVAVMRQLSAAKSATESAGVRLLTAALASCMEAAKDGDLSVTDFESLFVQLA